MHRATQVDKLTQIGLARKGSTRTPSHIKLSSDLDLQVKQYCHKHGIIFTRFVEQAVREKWDRINDRESAA